MTTHRRIGVFRGLSFQDKACNVRSPIRTAPSASLASEAGHVFVVGWVRGILIFVECVACSVSSCRRLLSFLRVSC
jgi:hypothetical protein